jgi:aminoglycoside 3-N-acetyltransferase
MFMTDLERRLDDAYATVGAYSADILYIYTDFRHFGVHMAGFPDRDAFCASIVRPLLTRGKTIVLTTFTYTSQGRFDVLTTPTRLGAMNKWITHQPGFRRSEHPIFSLAALGPQADLVTNVGKSAFGFESVYARLKGRSAAFLHVGRPVGMGNTVLHHVEQLCGATYRVHKAFRTEVYRGAEYVGTDYSALLRRRDVPGETFEFDFAAAAAGLFERGLVKQLGSDKDLSNISCYGYDQTLDFLCDAFYRDPRIFIKSDFIQY